LEDRVLLSFTLADTLLPTDSSVSKGEAGFSVAVAGNTAVLGAPFDVNPNEEGATYVFTESNGVWTQQARLVGTTSVQTETGVADQGVSVALSSDGNTLVFGAPHEGGDDTGAAYVFTRSNGVWTQQARLVGTDANGLVVHAGEQGTSVALSGDGNTLMVGAPFDSKNAGAEYVYTLSNGVWTQQARLIGTGANGAVDATGMQGQSVALSSDGNTAAAGAYSNSHGAAYVFTRSNGVWTQQTIFSDTNVEALGYSLSLSSDGNTLAAGAPNYKNGPGGGTGQGETYVFTRSNGLWTQQARLVGTAANGTVDASGAQGYSASLSGDGNILAVGAFGDNNATGATYVFTRSNGVWAQQDKLISTSTTGTSQQGESVSLAGDGSVLLVGAPADNTGKGAGLVFTPAATNPTISITPTSLPNAKEGVSYSQAFTAIGGSSPYQFALVNGQGTGLPAGLNFTSDGTLTGTPTVTGTFTFEVQATDSSPAPGPYTQTSPLLTLNVNAPTGGGGGGSGGSGSGSSSSGGSTMCSCNNNNPPSPELTSVGFLALLIEEFDLTLERVLDAILLDLGMPDESLVPSIDQLRTAIHNDAMFVPANFPGQLAVYLGQTIAVNALGIS
jgi:hypothetical protein